MCLTCTLPSLQLVLVFYFWHGHPYISTSFENVFGTCVTHDTIVPVPQYVQTYRPYDVMHLLDMHSLGRFMRLVPAYLAWQSGLSVYYAHANHGM